MRKEWKNGVLSDFVEQFIVPQRDKPKSFSGSIPWCRIEDINGKYLSQSNSGKCVTEHQIKSMPLRVFPKGTVIVSCSADLGRCAIVELPLITNQTFIGLVPKKELLPGYLYYSMINRAKELNSIATGATIKYLSKKKFQNLEFSLPPLEEQQRIVSTLDIAFDNYDRKMNQISENLELSKTLFSSILYSEFSNDIENWSESELTDVAYTAGRIGWKGLTAKEYTESGPLFLSVHSLNYGHYVDFRDANHISQERYDESPEIMLEPNDILICKDGAGIGKLGIVNEIQSPSTINGSLLLIRATEILLPKFLYYCLLSPYFQSIVQSRLEGSTTPHLYQRDIKQFPVRYPTVELQQRIVKKLDTVARDYEKLLSNYSRERENIDELKQSILQEAFSGKLTGGIDA
ncbi:restriction endonuclease subunit S [Candidatus Poseidonia alphae]|nr:restriction endonuclease subunit S [Candidatus Poseidonia alphae]